jgi:hypothetical protein
MYETLLTKIGTTLSKISLVKDNFYYPKTKMTKFPSVFYFPAGFENSYDTNAENFKIYRFNLFVIVGVSQTTLSNGVDVLAKTVQAIIAQFDEDWNQGTIDGHRVWTVINSGNPWQLSQEEDGQELSAQLTIEIKLLSTN